MACGSLFEFFFKFLLTSGLLLMDHARGAYGRCCEGQEIRVAALRSHWPPFWSWDGTNYPGGFNAASLRIIEEHTGYRARLVEIESPDAAGYVPAYTAMLRNGTADVAMGIRGPLDPRNMHYTVNTLQLRTKCAIHKVERADFTATGLRFLRPFDTALWLALLLGVSLVGVGILILRAVSGRAVTARFGAKSMYHAWAVFFGGDDYEWTTGPARLLRISLLFLVLISSASYTANLAAFFLMPDFEYRGPKNMADLSKSTVCFASQQWGWAAEPFARKVVYPPGGFARGKTNEELQEYCRDQLVSGNVDALCDVTGQLDTFLVQHCDDLWLVPDIDFAPSGVVWITSNDELMQNLSYAILETQSTPRWSRMAAAELNLGQTCKVELANTTPITLVHQRSVFVVFGVLLVSSLLLAVGERIVLARKSDGDPAVGIQLENQAAVNQSNRDSILKRIAAAEAELHQSIQALTASQTANAAWM